MSNLDFKPMKAERKSVHEWHMNVRTPAHAGYKLDGIRCAILNGSPVSNSLLPFPNKYIEKVLSRPELQGLDGELIVGNPTDENVYNNTQSVVMSKRSETDVCQFRFFVFDDFSNPALSYRERLDLAEEKVLAALPLGVPAVMVESLLYNSWEEILALENIALSAGYEGLILRAPFMPYKFGRSTAREQGMLKLKRFVDSEAEIIGFEELMHNDNEAYVDALGRTKRSSAQDGLVPGGTLGAFLARSNEHGDFRIGMFKGLTSADKKAIWERREEYLGKLVKFSYFPIGVKESPRHAKFVGFRDAIDL